jgi:hypothetical protein
LRIEFTLSILPVTGKDDPDIKYFIIDYSPWIFKE